MQQLLTGKRRLPGFEGVWKYIPAREIFKSITDKKYSWDLQVLPSTQDRGIVPRDQVGIDIKYEADSLSSYKKVEKGNFVISLRSFQGGIEYSDYTGIVSTAYTVLKSIEKISDEYYKQFFKSTDYINRLNIAVYTRWKTDQLRGLRTHKNSLSSSRRANRHRQSPFHCGPGKRPASSGYRAGEAKEKSPDAAFADRDCESNEVIG